MRGRSPRTQTGAAAAIRSDDGRAPAGTLTAADFAAPRPAVKGAGVSGFEVSGARGSPHREAAHCTRED
ncbi:hypothetical protein ACFPN0_11355 [Kitasatospora cinereorecta]